MSQEAEKKQQQEATLSDEESVTHYTTEQAIEIGRFVRKCERKARAELLSSLKEKVQARTNSVIGALAGDKKYCVDTNSPVQTEGKARLHELDNVLAMLNEEEEAKQKA